MALVLIVEDSPTQAHALRTPLERHGYDIVTANNGEDGLRKAQELRPDLILMDVIMPHLNGFQATRELAKHPETATIPVVMVTTKDGESDRVWGIRQGAFAYLVKPVSERELLDTARAALERRSA